MNKTGIVLPIGHYLWHKNAVPVFLERFVLPLFAATLVAIAVVNPMKFDVTQRVTGVVALIFAAYFVAYTVYKSSTPKSEPAPDFATVNILGAVVGTPENGFWGVYEDGSAKSIAPLNCILWLQIATRDQSVTLNYIGLEVRTTTGWMPLRRVSPTDINLFFGPIDQARQVQIAGPDIASVFYRDLAARSSVNGFAIYNYTNPDITLADQSLPEFRFTLINSLGETNKIEVKGDRPSDPFGGGSWRLNVIGRTPVDLSQMKFRNSTSQ